MSNRRSTPPARPKPRIITAHVSGLFALMRQRRPRGALVIERAGGAVDACATLMRGPGAAVKSI